MGNICRSPVAQGMFDAHARRLGVDDRFVTDSAGTHDYHVGRPPDPRSRRAAADFGVDISAQRARQVAAGDFHRFDLLVAMDQANHDWLTRSAPPHWSDNGLVRLLDYLPAHQSGDVPDPYYGDAADFRAMAQLLDRATRELLGHLDNR